MSKNFIKFKNVELDLSKIDSGSRFFNNIKKKRSTRTKIISNLNLDIQDGENLGIIGPNGAGKSTILRLISKIYRPTSGNIDVNGKCLGFFGNIFYDEYLTGYEFIVNSMLLFGFSKKQINKIKNRIIEFIDIGEYINRPQYTYSEGMKARVSFATVLFSNPSILLIDEGIGAGDRFFMEKAQKEINKVLGAIPILIISSHDERLLKKFTKKSILLINGNVVMYDETSVVLKYYRSDKFKEKYLSEKI